MGRPLKFETPEELQQKLDGFFDHCKKEEKNPTVEGLCVYLDCDKQTILNYEKRDEYLPHIERIKLQIADHVMGRAMTGEINPTIAIWISKNHYGYKDETSLNHGGQKDNPMEVKDVTQLALAKLSTAELEEILQHED